MASLNEVILICNLGRDPEARYTPNGAAICNIAQIFCFDNPTRTVPGVI